MKEGGGAPNRGLGGVVKGCIPNRELGGMVWLKVPGPISQNGDFFFKRCVTTQEILVSNFS